MHARPSFEFRSAMFRSALRRARTALQPLVTGARASAPHVERRALSTLCASDLAAAGRVSPVAAVRTALRRDIHHSSLLHDAASTDSSEKGLYQVLGEELEHERSTYDALMQKTDGKRSEWEYPCLLYTSDAADE